MAAERWCEKNERGLFFEIKQNGEMKIAGLMAEDDPQQVEVQLKMVFRPVLTEVFLKVAKNEKAAVFLRNELQMAARRLSTLASAEVLAIGLLAGGSDCDLEHQKVTTYLNEAIAALRERIRVLMDEAKDKEESERFRRLLDGSNLGERAE